MSPAKVKVFITQICLLVLSPWLFVSVGIVQFDVASSVLWKQSVKIEVWFLSVKVRNIEIKEKHKCCWDVTTSGAVINDEWQNMHKKYPTYIPVCIISVRRQMRTFVLRVVLICVSKFQRCSRYGLSVVGKAVTFVHYWELNAGHPAHVV